MNFADMMKEVYIKTNRPDLVTQTISALRAATLKMHTIDNFPKDIVNGQIVFDSLAYIQNLDTHAIPRYRKMVFIRKQDPTLLGYEQNPLSLPPLFGGLPGLGTSWSIKERLGFLRPINPDNIFDSYGVEKLNVFYQAGSTIWMKVVPAIQYALCGWYAFPNIDVSSPDNGVTYPNFSSWIADERPWAIIYDAVSNILQTIGMQEASRKYDSPATGTYDGGLVQNEIKRLIADNIVVEDDYVGDGD